MSLGVKMPVGSVTTSELSDITVCPKVLVVMTARAFVVEDESELEDAPELGEV